jgi:hypothetical protein
MSLFSLEKGQGVVLGCRQTGPISVLVWAGKGRPREEIGLYRSNKHELGQIN